MARLDSAAAIRVALNSLSPQDAWGDRASVSRMFDDGFRSLSHIANASPQLLTGYGVPLGQVGHLQHEAREALPRGEVIFVVKSKRGEFGDFEMCLPIHNNRILLETVEKRLGLHKPPLRMDSVNSVPAVARPADKTLAVDLQDGQRVYLMAEIAPGFRQFSAYPQPFSGFAKGLQWSWIHT